MHHQLNDAQKKAVEYTGGPLLIVAGAGTGKTAVLTEKIAYLLQQKLVAPENILALTFTEKAAEEMAERVDQLLDIGYTDMQISTFHAFAQRLLENYGLDIGLSNQFKILTQTDTWLLVRRNLEKFNLDYYRPLGNPARHIHELIRHFSKCKDELITPAEYLKYAEEIKLNEDTDPTLPSPTRGGGGKDFALDSSRLTEVANAYHTYNQLLLDNNSLDFGDLIFYATQLLQKRPQILQKLQQHFKYILVDEFQDVNWSQYQLVRMIAGRENQLTAVGDDDQSIYAFRGASISNILRFKDDYPEAKEIVLTKNYRSTQKILDLAYKLIQNNNPDRLETKLNINKKLKSEVNTTKSIATNGTEIEHLHCANLEEEVRSVINKINELHEKEAADWSDFAILVRANAHAGSFTNILQKRDIPYDFLASSGLYKQPIVLDALNFFKVIDNYHESSAVFRLLQMPGWNFSTKDLQKICYFTDRKSIGFYETIKRSAELKLSEAGQKICQQLLSLINNGMQSALKEKPTVILYKFLETSGYLQYLTHEETTGDREIIHGIRQLRHFFDSLNEFEIAHPKAHVRDFLEYYNYITEAGDEGALYFQKERTDSVKIMTVHGAKGLEFRYVFVVNLVEERFPTRRRNEGIEVPLPLIKEHLPEGDYHLQEERRLLYVALTRAKEKLFLTSAVDYGGARQKKISRFLTELNFENKSVASNREKTFVDGQLLINNKTKTINTYSTTQLLYEYPHTFSFSQINSYQRCPYQYKLAHLLKIPTKGNASFSFGQTLHNTLQQFYARMQELNGAKQNSLFDSTFDSADLKTKNTSQNDKVPAWEELLALYEKNWLDDWYESRRQREDYHKKGREILRIFYETQSNNWIIPVNLESAFKIKIGEYILNGRIDRVDKLTDGTLEIIDYKTGASKEKISGEDKDQLLLYQIAVSTLPQYKNLGAVGKLTYFYLNDNLKTSFWGSEEELGKLRIKIAQIIAKIRQGDFAATPSAHICARCDFRDICEFRQL